MCLGALLGPCWGAPGAPLGTLRGLSGPACWSLISVWWACTQQAMRYHSRHPGQKSLDSDRGVAAHDQTVSAGDGGHARSRQYADTPATPYKNNAQCPRGT
eukprot:6771130-Pyramimonas_sp.AAC.1